MKKFLLYVAALTLTASHALAEMPAMEASANQEAFVIGTMWAENTPEKRITFITNTGDKPLVCTNMVDGGDVYDVRPHNTLAIGVEEKSIACEKSI